MALTKEYRQSQGYKNTLEFYSDLRNYGWEFKENIPSYFDDWNIDTVKKFYRLKNIEACLMPVSFYTNGQVVTGGKALFIRKPNPQDKQIDFTI